jgi:hypothetical protein
MSAGAGPGRPRAVVNAVRCLSGVDAAAGGDDLAGRWALARMAAARPATWDGAEPASGHLPRGWAGSPGSILVSAASAGAAR